MPVAADIYYHSYEGGEEGEKPPVVLIHGAGGTHLYWPSEVRRLPGYRVLALDLPGHGKSAGRGQQSVEAYAQAVLEWMESVGMHSAACVGHSLGAAISLELALERPGQVLALGLLGASAHLAVPASVLENAALPTGYHHALDEMISLAFSAAAPARLVELAACRMAETRPSVLHGDFLAGLAFDPAGRLASISQPALLICGAQDRLTPPRQAQFLASQLPNATLEIIPEAGHMVMLEQPQAVAQALTNFLNQVSY